MINPIKLVFCLALFAAVCALEVFLSKRRAWWPGLVLPLCVLPNVVLNALGVAENSLQKVLSLLMGLLFFAPALVLLAIYWHCRRSGKHREQVEKIKIQDL